MLRPSPEHQRRLETGFKHIETSASIEKKRLKKAERRLRVEKGLMRASTFLSIASIPVALYASDVISNQEIQADAHIDVSVYDGEALDPANNNKALIFMDGFRSFDGDDLAKYRGAGLRQVLDGQLWSVGYNDANLDPKIIGKRIIQQAEQQGVEIIYPYGESAGGPVEMEALAYVAKNSDITIPAILMNSVPDGTAGLRQPRQEEVKIAQALSNIPGAKYSSLARFVGEMGFRSGDYLSDDGIDLVEAATTADDVLRLIDGNDIASSWLMFDQAMAIEDPDIKDIITKFGDSPATVQTPLMIYFSTARKGAESGIPARDYMVNDRLSSDNFEEAANKAGVPYIDIGIPGAVHSRPDINVKDFNKAVKKAGPTILSLIATQQAIAEFNQHEERRDEQIAQEDDLAEDR